MSISLKANADGSSAIQTGGIDRIKIDAKGVVELTDAVLPHVNDIVNGDFKIAQAGTSFAAPASGVYDLDGWLNGNNGTAAVLTIAQVAGSIAGRLARQVTITTADAAVGATDVVTDVTRIEGFNIEKYVGNVFTVAFRAKVPVVGIHCVALRNSGTDLSYVKEINFPTANVWQNCSFTVTEGLPTAGTWNYTNGVGLSVAFTHMCGTTFQTTPDAWNTGNFLGTANQVNDCATVNNVWALEKVTMNLGTVAAVSEISFEQELVRCQRYYEIGAFFHVGYVGGVMNLGSTVKYAVVKRVSPTITQTNGNASNCSVTTQNGNAGAPTEGFLSYRAGNAAGAADYRETWTASARL